MRWNGKQEMVRVVQSALRRPHEKPRTYVSWKSPAAEFATSNPRETGSKIPGMLYGVLYVGHWQRATYNNT